MSCFIRAWIPAYLAALLSLGGDPIARAEPVEPEGETVINLVEGRSLIRSVKPAGSLVREGEIVCELDSTDLKARLARQVIATKEA